MRTAIIYYLGIQYLGLNGLFTSVLSILNLAELGVGSAMVYSMYKPIANDDVITICALMQLYKKYYLIIGGLVAVIGIALTPSIPLLIKSDIPAGINVYILYLLNLTATVLSYWLFAHKISVLLAHQRNDVVSKVTLATNTFQYGIQFLVLWLTQNYYLYVIVALLTQVLTNIVTAIVASKIYPQYKARGRISGDEIKLINKRIRDLFTSKFGAVIVNSADTIVISAFLGLNILALYQNYYFIISSVIGFVTIIFTSCTAGIGNSLVVESQEKNFSDLNKFTFIVSWISGFCSCCFLCLFQPFMEIWVGEKLMLGYSAVVCFVIYYYIYEINQLLNLYKDAGGIWHKDRYRPLVTALTNICMNIVMVRFWDLYGVLLSTVISMLCVGMPWIIINLFSTLFERKLLPVYIKKLFVYCLVSIFCCVVTVLLCNFINIGKWFTLILRFIICLIIPNVLFFIIYRNTVEFVQCIDLVDKITRGKFGLMRLKSRNGVRNR